MINLNKNQCQITKTAGLGRPKQYFSIWFALCACSSQMVGWGRCPFPRRVNSTPHHPFKQFSAGWGWCRTLQHVQMSYTAASFLTSRLDVWNASWIHFLTISNYIIREFLVVDRDVLTWLYCAGGCSRWTYFSSKSFILTPIDNERDCGCVFVYVCNAQSFRKQTHVL
jgi:hypothetical protein